MELTILKKGEKVCVTIQAEGGRQAACLLTLDEVQDLQDKLTRVTLEIFAQKFFSGYPEGRDDMRSG